MKALTLSFAFAAMAVTNAFAGPPQLGPIEVTVTNPSIPVNVQPSWTTLSEVYRGWNRFTVPGFEATTGGGAMTFEIFDHVVVTEVFVSASSAAPAETAGDCLATIAGNTQATGYKELAAFSVPAGHYGARTISLPNLYFTAAGGLEYLYVYGQNQVGASGDTYACKFFFEVRYVNAD